MYNSVSSAMILQSVNTCLKTEQEQLQKLCGETPPDIVVRIEDRIHGLLEQVSALAIAHYGVTRRNPSFDLAEVHKSVKSMTAAMKVIADDETAAMLSRMHEAM